MKMKMGLTAKLISGTLLLGTSFTTLYTGRNLVKISKETQKAKEIIIGSGISADRFQSMEASINKKTAGFMNVFDKPFERMTMWKDSASKMQRMRAAKEQNRKFIAASDTINVLKVKIEELKSKNDSIIKSHSPKSKKGSTKKQQARRTSRK